MSYIELALKIQRIRVDSRVERVISYREGVIVRLALNIQRISIDFCVERVISCMEGVTLRLALKIQRISMHPRRRGCHVYVSC